MKKLEVLDKIEKVVYVTQPSPVILVSTISKNNVDNVAPFAMFMNCSTKPDNMVAIAISSKTDTYSNIKETKQFIIGIPKDNILDKLYKAGEKVDKNAGMWDISVTGDISTGQDELFAASREINEEVTVI